MPEGSTLGLFATTAFVVLVVPGPAVLYIVSRSIEHGRMAGLASVLGVGVGSSVQVVAAAIGGAALFLSSPLAFAALRYAGAGYLAYLGIRELIEAGAEAKGGAVSAGSSVHIFGQGVLVTLLSPGSILFSLAFLPQFVDPSRGAVGGQILLLGLVFVLLGVAVGSAWALAAGTAGGWVRRNARFVRAQRYVAGAVFILLGVVAALSGRVAR